MLGRDPSGAPPPAMRSALLRLLAAGLLLLGSAPGTGVGASSSPPPSASSVVTTTKPISRAPPSALPTPATSGKPISSLTGLTTLKPESPLPPSASSSPSPAGPPEAPAVGTSPKTVSASAPGSGAAGGPDLPVSVAPVRSTPEGTTLAHVASPTSRTSPEGVASKDLASSGQTSKPSLLPTTPSVPKPGGSTEKSSGSPPVSIDISARPAVISGSVTPESPTTKKDVITHRENVAPLSSTLVPGHSKMTDRTAPTVIKPTGPASGTTSPSSMGDISTPPDLKIKPSLVPLTTASLQERHSLPPASGTNHTSLQARSKIVCEKTAVDNRMILLTLNESKPCNSLEGTALKETLLETLCKAVKPNLNQDRDECTVRLASDREDPARLAVVGVSVQTNSVEDELSEALAAKKAQLEKLGVHNITHGGRLLDTEPRDHLSLPLIITIICMAASLLLVAAIYGCCHQRLSHRKDQQRLTEELHTIENGYHDNPTLEVTEISSEMQEKKINLNGELGDSWIVPMDSLVKDDLDEEEDTHL